MCTYKATYGGLEVVGFTTTAVPGCYLSQNALSYLIGGSIRKDKACRVCCNFSRVTTSNATSTKFSPLDFTPYRDEGKLAEMALSLLLWDLIPYILQSRHGAGREVVTSTTPQS